MSSRSPHQPSPGVQGVNVTGIIDKIGDVIGLKRPNSNPAKKLEELSLEYDFMHHQAEAAYAAIKDYYTALGDADGRLARVKATPLNKNFTADQLAAAVAQAEQEVARCRAAYDAALARSKAANKARNITRKHLLRAQIAYGRGDINPVTPVPFKGDPDEAIVRIDVEIRKVKAAPRPQNEVVGEAVADLDRQASEAKVRVSFGTRVAVVGWPIVRINAEPSGQEIPHTYDPRPWLARFHRDELVADIKAQVAEKYIGVELTLSERDKAKRLADLAQSRLQADRARAQVTWDRRAADPTAPLDFADDMDIAAVLGIELRRAVILPEDDDRNPGGRG